MIHTAAIAPDAAIAISAYLARTRYEDLPEDSIAATKASILDTIGCAIAGTSGTDIPAIRGLVEAWGGRPSSTIVGGGGLKVPGYNAVLANAALVHQDDYDDTYDT
ncbi:MAG: MmgE/PrpD family protein, partial [Rhodopila sp.]